MLIPAPAGYLGGTHAEEAALSPVPKAAHHDPKARPWLIGPEATTGL